MKRKQIITIAIVVVLVAGLSFWGGMKFGRSGSSARGGQFAGMRSGQSAGKNIRLGGGLIAGEILSKDDKSLTVKTSDGSTKIIFYAPSTRVEKTIDGTSADLVAGKSVSVVGISNTDGSVTAKSVQLRTVPVIPPQNQPAQ